MTRIVKECLCPDYCSWQRRAFPLHLQERLTAGVFLPRRLLILVAADMDVRAKKQRLHFVHTFSTNV